MKNDSVAIGIIGAGIMGERLLNAILQQGPARVHACGIWDPAPQAMQRMAKTFPEVPRLADAPWAMECKTWQIINVKEERQLIIGEGTRFHIRDELWDPKAMRVQMDKYHPVGRMFADRYCRTDDRMDFPAAPVVKAEAAE